MSNKIIEMIEFMEYYNSKSTKDKVILTMKREYTSDQINENNIRIPGGGYRERIIKKKGWKGDKSVFWGWTHMKGNPALFDCNILDNLYVVKIKKDRLVEIDYSSFNDYLNHLRSTNINASLCGILLDRVFKLGKDVEVRCNFMWEDALLMDTVHNFKTHLPKKLSESC